ncbi:MAG: S8 family serine peptidase [Arcobacteraceae bacterium]|jgi:subtilisin family serine protease|nr:S8 family serine peptidase [Arcobacteraceae bacterium]
MKLSFFILLITLFLSGCGSSSDSGTIIDTRENLYNEQWYLEEDATFYNLHGIDSDAHIHPNTTTYETYTGKGVKVAIIDNGFDINHPEIKDTIIATSSVQTDETIISDVSQSDSDDNHGTAVTGIIGGKDDGVGIRGIAPNSSLILIKMPLLLSDSTIIKLFQQAIYYGADVINCSWGTHAVSQTVRDYINFDITRTARNGKGVVVVFAAGNNNSGTMMESDESGIENVIGVGATDGDNLRTHYSNYGNLLDIVAPGGYYHSIATIDPIGINGATEDEYNRYNQTQDAVEVGFIGTSASAPILTGAIALLLEKDPNLTSAQVQEKLKIATDTIGQNTPYLYDMVSSNSQTPTISGIYGTNINTTFQVKLTSNDTNTTYGPYPVISGTNNTWNSTVTDTLPNGNYTINLVDGTTIWATDDDFIINTALSYSTINTARKKSNYYGYGKINLSKLLQ